MHVYYIILCAPNHTVYPTHTYYIVYYTIPYRHHQLPGHPGQGDQRQVRHRGGHDDHSALG